MVCATASVDVPIEAWPSSPNTVLVTGLVMGIAVFAVVAAGNGYAALELLRPAFHAGLQLPGTALDAVAHITRGTLDALADRLATRRRGLPFRGMRRTRQSKE